MGRLRHPARIGLQETLVGRRDRARRSVRDFDRERAERGLPGLPARLARRHRGFERQDGLAPSRRQALGAPLLRCGDPRERFLLHARARGFLGATSREIGVEARPELGHVLLRRRDAPFDRACDQRRQRPLGRAHRARHRPLHVAPGALDRLADRPCRLGRSLRVRRAPRHLQRREPSRGRLERGDDAGQRFPLRATRSSAASCRICTVSGASASAEYVASACPNRSSARRARAAARPSIADAETPAADVPKLRVSPCIGAARLPRRASTSPLLVSASRAPRRVSKRPRNVPRRPSMTRRPTTYPASGAPPMPPLDVPQPRAQEGPQRLARAVDGRERRRARESGQLAGEAGRATRRARAARPWPRGARRPSRARAPARARPSARSTPPSARARAARRRRRG